MKLSGPSIALDIDQTPLSVFGGWTAFSQGPDGKIYNLFRHNHNVINYPDEKGLACDFCLASDNLPSCLDVPFYLYSGYYPNYRLGALTGSGCDTISTSISTPGVSRFELIPYPNPTSGPVQVEITLPDYGRQDTELVIHDALGREVHRHRYPPYAYLYTWDTSNVPSGTYVLQLVSDLQTVATNRVVVMREWRWY
ncbi:MAG: T9SS type A sorting domain-containing protein [Saprospiraceae bacterium]|nr:T9SS type A sorting domain-containing protein [Saprospiraceae bacterium]